MLPTLHFTFIILTICLSVYGFVTLTSSIQWLVMMSLSMLILVFGLEELKEERKVHGWIAIAVFIFIFVFGVVGYFS